MTFSVQADRKLVPADGARSEVRVTIRASDREAEGSRRVRPPLSLGLVLDCSGSMNGLPGWGGISHSQTAPSVGRAAPRRAAQQRGLNPACSGVGDP